MTREVGTPGVLNSGVCPEAFFLTFFFLGVCGYLSSSESTFGLKAKFESKEANASGSRLSYGHCQIDQPAPSRTYLIALFVQIYVHHFR
jgi:hypothetical protein